MSAIILAKCWPITVFTNHQMKNAESFGWTSRLPKVYNVRFWLVNVKWTSYICIILEELCWGKILEHFKMILWVDELNERLKQ